MKKLLVAIGLFIFMSCSNDDKDNTVKENVNLSYSTFRDWQSTDLDKAYEQMINSDSYKMYLSELDIFMSNVYFLQQGMEFHSEDETMNWISKNINKTNFEDYDEAVKALSIVNMKADKAFKDNETFISLTRDFTPQDIVKIMLPPANTVPNNDCQILCEQGRQNCNAGAERTFGNAMEDAHNNATSHEDYFGKFVKAAKAYTASLKGCHQSFGKCTSKC